MDIEKIYSTQKIIRTLEEFSNIINAVCQGTYEVIVLNCIAENIDNMFMIYWFKEEDILK